MKEAKKEKEEAPTPDEKERMRKQAVISKAFAELSKKKKEQEDAV